MIEPLAALNSGVRTLQELKHNPAVLDEVDGKEVDGAN